MAFVATAGRIAEVLDHIGRPLVGLGQQHPARIFVVDHLAAPLQEGVRLRQVLAVGALPLEQVGHGVEAEPVDAEVQPEPQDIDHRLLHGRVVVVQVGLMGEEPVPVELAPHRVEGPVGLLGVDEDDPGLRVAIAGVAPDVEVAVGPVRIAAGLHEPGVGVGGVVHHQVGDDPDAATVRRVKEGDEVVHGAELGQHLVEVADVIAAVTQRRVVKRRQPKAVDPEPLQIVQPVDQSEQIPCTVAVGVGEGAHQHLVEHRALEPDAVGGEGAGVGEVLGGGMRHHTAFDMSAMGRADRQSPFHWPGPLPLPRSGRI